MTLTFSPRSPIFRRIEVWVQSNYPPSLSSIGFLTSEIYSRKPDNQTNRQTNKQNHRTTNPIDPPLPEGSNNTNSNNHSSGFEIEIHAFTPCKEKTDPSFGWDVKLWPQVNCLTVPRSLILNTFLLISILYKIHMPIADLIINSIRYKQSSKLIKRWIRKNIDYQMTKQLTHFTSFSKN